MSKQVEFEGKIVIKNWHVYAGYKHPDVFEITIFQDDQDAEGFTDVELEMTKAQFTDLRNLFKAVDLAEQIFI